MAIAPDGFVAAARDALGVSAMRDGDAEGSSRGLPDPWRASGVAIALSLAAVPALAWFVSPVAGVAAGWTGGLIVGGIALAAEMQAAWRLRRALAAFAAALPPDGREGFQSWTSEQGIRWPHLGVSVSGRVASYRVDDLAVEVGPNSFLMRPRDARRAGEELARRMGIHQASRA